MHTLTHITEHNRFLETEELLCVNPTTRHIYKQYPSLISLCELISITAYVLQTQKLKIWLRVLFRVMTRIKSTPSFQDQTSFHCTSLEGFPQDCLN